MIQATVAYTPKFIVEMRDTEREPPIEVALSSKKFLKVEETYPSGNRVLVTAEVSRLSELKKLLGRNFVAEVLPKMDPYRV